MEYRNQFPNFGAMVYRNRKKQKLTQIVISSLMGYKNGQFISNIERGKSGIPPKNWKHLSNVLKIPMAEIIETYIQDVRYNLQMHAFGRSDFLPEIKN